MTVDATHTTTFAEIPTGGCFQFGDHFYIKLNTEVIVKWSSAPGNAVILDTGTPILFKNEDRVTHLPLARIVTQ